MQFILLACLLCAPVFAQTKEVATEQEAFTFKSKVNLVMVPVVVRDKKGQPVDRLQKQDFQLFDRGKPQEITKFSIEHPGSRAIPVVNIQGDGVETQDRTIDAPNHFVAYMFDDIHMEFADMVHVRDAARKHLAAVSHPGTRFAVYTTSGQTTQEFTEDPAAIERALLSLRPHPIARTAMQECPDISYYMADLIANHRDPSAIGAATAETISCMNTDAKTAALVVESTARRNLNAGDQETRVALLTISDIVRRLSGMPGERTLLLVSPGFIRLNDQLSEESTLMDRATRASVIINALDARGLYTDVSDISKRFMGTQVEIVKQQLNREAARASADVMAELADGTGGTFFQNSNDLQGGFDKLSGAPAVYYVLGFSPQNLKLDGAFHALKIRVKEPTGLDVKARRGYYAPHHLSNADDDAKEEISQALFSREEMSDIPLDLHTQFFKASEAEAHLQVAARVDVRNLHFRKAEGANNDDVMIVSALFDRNGNYLQGMSKILKMKLRDVTLQTRVAGGITVRSDFTVAPGTYIIRLVIRDGEGQMMAARNGAVEIR